VGDNHEETTSELESKFLAAGKTGKLGKLNDQVFYALRHNTSENIKFPFSKQKFGALLNIAAATDEQILEKIARQLLEHGLAFALCTGEQSDLMSEIIDRLIDENNFTHDGFTPYSSIEEGLSDAMQYFALPTGITQTSLIITIGNDDDQGSAMNLFDNLFGGEIEIENLTEDEWLWTVLQETFNVTEMETVAL